MNIFTKIGVLLLIAIIGTQVHAQRIGDLDGINYQAVAVDEDGEDMVGKDVKGKPLFKQEIGVRFSIHKGQDGEIQYQEKHTTLTGKDGHFSLTIGHGEETGSGKYSKLLNIPWIDADQWLKVEISIENDGNYKMVSFQQFMTVPYSFYTDDIADNAITTEKILNEEVKAQDIDTGAVETSEILDSTIINEDVATGAVDSRSILDETILAEDINTGAVETSEILDSTIINKDVATGAVDSRTIENNTIQEEDVDIEAITSNEIKNLTVLNEDIADGTINLAGKVTDTLPVENGGTGRAVVEQGDIMIGNGTAPLDTISVTDSAMLFSNKGGNTDLYKLRPGPRTSITVDESTKTITITAKEQAGGPGTGTGSVSTSSLGPGDQQVANFPAPGVSPGDIILATIDTDLKGITLTSYVKQADQVNVVFFNGTNKTINLGNVTVNFASFGQP